MFQNRGRCGLTQLLGIVPALWGIAIVMLCPAGNARGQIAVSPATLPDWTVNAPYLVTLSATGCTGACVWSVSNGRLPAGLTLSLATGSISGTPSATGSSRFTITATDVSNNRGSQAYTVQINPVPAISNPSLANATVGAGYSQTLQVSGGTPPYSFSIASGSPPSGLTLDASSGVISGTPTSAGSSTFTVGLSDAAQSSATRTLTITVNPGSLSITGAQLPGGMVGSAYSQSLSASGGTPPYQWSVAAGSAPPGLSLNPSSGVLSGTPTVTGTSTFTVQVMDSKNATASGQFTLAIGASNQPLSITTGSPLPNGTVGTVYSQTLAATGGGPPYAWSVSSGALPAGLSLDGSSGTLAGTPTAAGSSAFIVQVTDSVRNAVTKAFTLSIASGTANLSIITSSLLPGATQGAAYSQALAATGGKPPYSWSTTSGSLPDGLTLNGPSGTITGTPSSTGSFTFNVQVADSASATASQLFSIAVGGPSSNPTLTISGVPATANSGAQVPLGVTLSAAYE